MRRIFYKLTMLTALCTCLCSMTWAQFTATGSVADPNGEPIIGATVVVKGTALGTFTTEGGKFSLEVPGSSGTLVITFVGLGTEEIEVSSSSGPLTVSLKELETTLDEVLVTGLATTVKRSNLANSVGQIKAAELTGVTTQPTLDGALYGKFKGAEIRANSGAPGGGMSVKLRGVTSIFGDQQPLYIVDGVYIDNSSISLGTNIVSAAAGGGNTSTNQDDASNRIADIDPEDIESVEILKGASAAAIYGSRAAGGVVIITTKKGRGGVTKVKLSQTVGASRPIRLLGQRDWDSALILEEFGQADVDLFNQNGLRDYEAELYDRTGFLATSRMDISGGNEKTTFFVGGTYKTEDGIVDNTGYEKASGRVNIGHRFADWLKVDVTNNFINSTADRGFFNNGNTNTTIGYALAFTKPWEDLSPDEDGVYPAVPAVGSNVLETIAITTNREQVNRYIGGVTADARLFYNEKNDLKLLLRAGVDQYTLRTTGIFPQALSFYRSPGTLGGVSISGTTINTNSNLEAFLIHSLYVNQDLFFRTQIGIQQLDFNQNTVIATATGLNGSQTNIDQAAQVSGFQNRQIQQDKGFFIQEEVNWKDRIIATVGLRADKSSNNGDANQLFYYPKANLAVNFHEFDFWGTNFFSNFKTRIAYGQSGRFANFQDRFNPLNGTLIGGNSGLQTVGLRGNSTVTPERQAELEFGADFGFWENILTLDVTYYIKTIDDLLLRAQVPSSSGFTNQVLNAGALRNNGIEIGLKANPFRGEFSWNFGFQFWRNQSLVTRLDIPGFNIGGFAASLGQYRIAEGQSATQIVGTFNEDDCGTPDCSDLDPDGDGFRVYGNAEPDFNLSFSNNLSYKNFELNFLWHLKQGGDGINLSTLLYDLGQLTWDYDDKTLDPEGQVANGPFRLGSGDASPWIEDAGYIRLREVGLFYRIPRSSLGDVLGLKLGVSGRNLLNFFDYNSYDPEVSNFGNNVLANAVEVTPYPSQKRFFFHISADF